MDLSNPRAQGFGPQSAYGLISSEGPGQPPAWSSNLWLRSSQIGAQRNGVLYTDNALLATPAFLGRAVDYSQDPLNGWGDPLRRGQHLQGLQIQR